MYEPLEPDQIILGHGGIFSLLFFFLILSVAGHSHGSIFGYSVAILSLFIFVFIFTAWLASLYYLIVHVWLHNLRVWAAHNILECALQCVIPAGSYTYTFWADLRRVHWCACLLSALSWCWKVSLAPVVDNLLLRSPQLVASEFRDASASPAEYDPLPRSFFSRSLALGELGAEPGRRVIGDETDVGNKDSTNAASPTEWSDPDGDEDWPPADWWDTRNQRMAAEYPSASDGEGDCPPVNRFTGPHGLTTAEPSTSDIEDDWHDVLWFTRCHGLPTVDLSAAEGEDDRPPVRRLDVVEPTASLLSTGEIDASSKAHVSISEPMPQETVVNGEEAVREESTTDSAEVEGLAGQPRIDEPPACGPVSSLPSDTWVPTVDVSTDVQAEFAQSEEMRVTPAHEVSSEPMQVQMFHEGESNLAAQPQSIALPLSWETSINAGESADNSLPAPDVELGDMEQASDIDGPHGPDVEDVEMDEIELSINEEGSVGFAAPSETDMSGVTVGFAAPPDMFANEGWSAACSAPLEEAAIPVTSSPAPMPSVDSSALEAGMLAPGCTDVFPSGFSEEDFQYTLDNLPDSLTLDVGDVLTGDDPVAATTETTAGDNFPQQAEAENFDSTLTLAEMEEFDSILSFMPPMADMGEASVEPLPPAVPDQQAPSQAPAPAPAFPQVEFVFGPQASYQNAMPVNWASNLDFHHGNKTSVRRGVPATRGRAKPSGTAGVKKETLKPDPRRRRPWQLAGEEEKPNELMRWHTLTMEQKIDEASQNVKTAKEMIISWTDMPLSAVTQMCQNDSEFQVQIETVCDQLGRASVLTNTEAALPTEFLEECRAAATALKTCRARNAAFGNTSPVFAPMRKLAETIDKFSEIL